MADLSRCLKLVPACDHCRYDLWDEYLYITHWGPSLKASTQGRLRIPLCGLHVIFRVISALS